MDELLTPKLGRCVDDAENLYRAGGAVVVVAAHDAAVVHVADVLGRQRGVPVRIWLGVSDAVPVPDGDRFVPVSYTHLTLPTICSV